MVTIITVSASRGRGSTGKTTQITTREPRMQKLCTLSFVETTHDSPSSLPSASRSASPVSGFWLGLVLAFTAFCCSSSTSDYNGTALDWTLLGSLAFQLFFFWHVVWRALYGFLHRQLGNVSRFWAWCWACFQVLHGILMANWDWARGWNFGGWSITRMWKHGTSASSFRRLGEPLGGTCGERGYGR